jgi:hypothetical protein
MKNIYANLGQAKISSRKKEKEIQRYVGTHGGVLTGFTTRETQAGKPLVKVMFKLVGTSNDKIADFKGTEYEYAIVHAPNDTWGPDSFARDLRSVLAAISGADVFDDEEDWEGIGKKAEAGDFNGAKLAIEVSENEKSPEYGKVRMTSYSAEKKAS